MAERPLPAQPEGGSEIDEQPVPELVHSPSSLVSSSRPDVPFFCPICSKKFSRRRDYLRRHKCIHERQRLLYQCHLCRKTFTRDDSRKRHLRNSCPVAKERFHHHHQS
ncbi:hypothetical protein BJV82DRAFT_636207 [Fennellomyces sp. T-0311]|nr:hypothetical protein BJV82DRAFT_636207 [Fennellomyces sp. T-0311]